MLEMIRDSQAKSGCGGKRPCPTELVLSGIATTKTELVFRLRQSLTMLEMIRDTQAKGGCGGKRPCPTAKVLSGIVKMKAEIATLAPPRRRMAVSREAITALVATQEAEARAAGAGVSTAVIVGGLAVVGVGAFLIFR